MDILEKVQIGVRGICLVDKPLGKTSHDVVNQVRRLSGEKRVGHAGTLDPLATGLLIILIGRTYTKQQNQFMKLDKTYEVECKFGVATTTYDLEGDVAEELSPAQVSLTRKELEEAMQHFTGEITQQVPVFSAVKVQGQKLYALARENDQRLKDLKLPTRQVSIYSFSLIDFHPGSKENYPTARFEVQCSSGTYIRSLIHDLGQFLKIGATVTNLRRTEIGSFSVDDALVLA